MELLTWMDAVAGDVGSSEPLGELVGEEHVAQFAAAVRLEELPAVAAGAQVSVHRQSLNASQTHHKHSTNASQTHHKRITNTVWLQRTGDR